MTAKAPNSVYATLGSEVHEQMFRSGGQSDAKPPGLNFQASLNLKFRGVFVDYRGKLIRGTCLKGKTARQHAIEQQRETHEFELEKLRLESELHKLWLETKSIRSNFRWRSCAEDPKKMSSNYRISVVRAEDHVRETSPAVLMAKATIPVTIPIKEEKEIDELRVVLFKVKGEQEMVNAAIDTGAQIPVIRADVVEGQSIDNRGTIQITSTFEEHEMGELKSSNMEINDLRHGVVPVSKNLVNDMLICSSDYEGLIENSQLVCNPAILQVSSKKEIINSVN
ncbi:hypothetical protein TNCV_3643191 [Trichonephila clavipes]|nr:hypothetical protein TNCV_3643191 [Trichonephila clavipes]